jgi:hypothetical protein
VTGDPSRIRTCNPRSRNPAWSVDVESLFGLL